MPAAELALATLAEAQDAIVLSQNARLEHVPHHRNAVIFGYLRHDGAEPSIEVRARDATQLQCKPHNLLGVDMRWSGGWRHGIDHALVPKRSNGECGEQLLVIGGKKKAVPLCAGAAPGAPHPLQEGRDTPGAPICTTRSRSPTLMPSSKVPNIH